MNRMVHWEIPSTDVRKSADFYAKLFGWKMVPSFGGYMTFEVEGGVGGGINPVDKMPEPGIDVYIGVDDIPATLKLAEQLGGRTAKPKTEIGGGMGFYAFLTDPCGCRTGVWAKK